MDFFCLDVNGDALFVMLAVDLLHKRMKYQIQ